GGEGQTICVTERMGEGFAFAVRCETEEPAVAFFPLARVGDVEIPGGVEDGKIGADQLVLAGVGGEELMFSRAIDADQARGGIADDHGVVVGEEGDAGVEAAERAELFDLARWVDAVDLTRLAAGPEEAVAVEREGFGMI